MAPVKDAIASAIVVVADRAAARTCIRLGVRRGEDIRASRFIPSGPIMGETHQRLRSAVVVRPLMGLKERKKERSARGRVLYPDAVAGADPEG